MSSRPKVFISYTHDNEQHKWRVYELSEKLRDGGIDSNIDQYEIDPPEGWPRWMASQIETADFVLVVASRDYLNRFEGKEIKGLGAGAKWEGGLIIQDLYEAEGANTKFLPLIFTSEDRSYIPLPLRGKTYFQPTSDEGFKRLYRRLTGQSEVQRGDVSKELRILPPLRQYKSPDSASQGGQTYASPQGIDQHSPESSELQRGRQISSRRALNKGAKKTKLESETERFGKVAEDLPLPTRRRFVPEVLDRTVIAIPLLQELTEERISSDSGARKKSSHVVRMFDVIIELNNQYPGSSGEASARVRSLLEAAIKKSARSGAKQGPTIQRIDEEKSSLSRQYLFARLKGSVIRELARLDSEPTNIRGSHTASARAIQRIWPDFSIAALQSYSLQSINAEAAHRTFNCTGAGVVWAVVDSGIDSSHPHFARHRNLDLSQPVSHRDFSVQVSGQGSPLTDRYGHGTHIAGIIGGERVRDDWHTINAVRRWRDSDAELRVESLLLDQIRGVAPQCKLVSLKVLDDIGVGSCSSVLVALEYVNKINEYGRLLRIHGVNLSVGYEIDPEWFASGLSPLCNEVNRLVQSGVVVVAPAGNSGNELLASPGIYSGINDPGNAEHAITVGSTHETLPDIYGVSFFSSKGPTADGRPKPDIVAPGETVISCASGQYRAQISSLGLDSDYVEGSGTSQAASHVSGAIAAFLSIQPQFIGRPRDVKKLFLTSAKDLGRVASYQGSGLVDLKKALESA